MPELINTTKAVALGAGLALFAVFLNEIDLLRPILFGEFRSKVKVDA